jgi:hypothetical protein
VVIDPWMGVLVMAKTKAPKASTSSTTVASSPKPAPKGAAPVSLPKALIQYPLPQVLNATTNNTLPPMSSTSGTVVIITAAIATGVLIKVFWAIKGQEANPVFTATAKGTGNAGVQVPVPAWVVGFCIGQTLTIWYEALNDSSLRLELTVEVIDPIDMPVAVFTDLVFFQGSWWLDMAKFPGNAGVELCAWPFIAAGQRLWVEVVGNEHLSPMRFYWILENHVVTPEEAQSGFCFLLEILREWLAGNEDWSSLTIHTGVTYNGAEGTAPEDPSISHIPANAHPFQRATANLRVREAELNLLRPTLREAVYVEGKGHVLNPVLTVNGGHVEVAYDGMKPGDHVCVTFAGTPGLGSPVLPCQDVQGNENKLVFPVPASAISANFGKPVVISFTVLRDRLWPSQKLTVQVLEPTGLKGIDVDEKTDHKLCLNNFPGDGTATVDVWDYAAVGQTCWLWIVGRREDGSELHWDVLLAEPVKPEWLTDGVRTTLAREELEKLADCLVFEIRFAVNFRGLADKDEAIAFRPLQLQMIQADLVLLAPSVREAILNHLTVWNCRDGVTVRVEYDRMSSHHTITLCWEQAGVCLALASKPGNSTAGYVEFSIPREAVIYGIGKTVPIRYSVASRCRQQTSADLGLDISTPVRLPETTIVEATNSILDLRTFAGDAHISVAQWWFILANQKGWLEARGTGEDGLPHVIKVMIGQDVNVEDLSGLTRVLERAELLKLKNNTSLTVQFMVTPDGVNNVNHAVPFPPSQDLLFTKKILDVTEFTNENWNDWTPGAGAADPRDLTLKTDPDGRVFLFDWGYTDTQDPLTQREKLVKTYSGLAQGRLYEFRADLRNNSGANPAPRIALTANGVEIYPANVLTTRVWITIRGTFTATATTARLSIDNLQMGVGGNDFDISRIILEEL